MKHTCRLYQYIAWALWRGAERSTSGLSNLQGAKHLLHPWIGHRMMLDLRADILLDRLACRRADAPQPVIPPKRLRTLPADEVLKPPLDRPHQPLRRYLPAGC